MGVASDRRSTSWGGIPLRTLSLITVGVVHVYAAMHSKLIAFAVDMPKLSAHTGTLPPQGTSLSRISQKTHWRDASAREAHILGSGQIIWLVVGMWKHYGTVKRLPYLNTWG